MEQGRPLKLYWGNECLAQPFCCCITHRPLLMRMVLKDDHPWGQMSKTVTNFYSFFLSLHEGDFSVHIFDYCALNVIFKKSLPTTLNLGQLCLRHAMGAS